MSLQEAAAETTFFDRTLRNLAWAWREVAASARGAIGAAPRPSLPREDGERLRVHMLECLEGRGGEVSARARAAELGRAYLSLDAGGRRNFLLLLAGFDVDPAVVETCIEQFRTAPDPESRGEAERGLRKALEPGRLRLLTQFNALPEGVKFLVDLRGELLPLAATDPSLRALEGDLEGLLKSWFDVGFLELRRITWESSAALLEKLIAYEAVHEIRGWDDLKDRLDSDRRCFAFFHPRMPDEPLIFVEVALVNGMADNVQELLDNEAPVQDPRSADTAIFYSISNCQKGLVGVSFGTFLIKRVVDSLTAEFDNLRSFATLSPIPGFRRWLDQMLAEKGDALLLPAERERLHDLLGPTAEPVLSVALARSTWTDDDATLKQLRAPLSRLCATYLLTEKVRGRARDPVANFHLNNGARMERLNWMADSSPKGIRESFGFMINYLYRLDRIAENHESYAGEGKIAASSAMRALAKG